MCPACESKRLHWPIDWAQHPYAGHGYVPGHGWTHPDLAGVPQDTGAAASQISGEVTDAAAPVAREKP